MTEPWRFACPEGHRSLRKRHGTHDGPAPPYRHWYCHTCKKSYREVTDLKTEERVTA